MDRLEFPSAKVAAAIGMSHDNFRAHLSRKGWRIIDKSPAEAGKALTFSMEDVLGYALARVLTSYGVDTVAAFDRAMQDFAHAGDERRDRAGVYDVAKHGHTYYAFTLGMPRGKILTKEELSTQIPELIGRMTMGGAEGAILIDLTILRDRVFQALGLDARDYE